MKCSILDACVLGLGLV
jgi:purine nucleoside phosphorylase